MGVWKRGSCAVGARVATRGAVIYEKGRAYRVAAPLGRDLLWGADREVFPGKLVLDGGSMEGMREFHRRAARDRRVRWFLVAAVFTAVGLGLLKLFVDVFHWHYAVSTFVQSEACNLARFFVNDRWVFGRGRPTWHRLWQYHVANALGFAVWWAGANALKAAGVNYLLASVLAMLGSVGVSLLTNFKWIWRKRHPERENPDAPECVK